jgi:microcystin-dependent protein
MADTVPADYLPCDGRVIPTGIYADLFAVIGNKYNTGTGADGTTTFALPDLRGMFLRGIAGDGGAAAVGEKQQDTTRMPRTPFGTDSQGGHHHGMTTEFFASHQGWTMGNSTSGVNNPQRLIAGNNHRTGDAGAHTHTITGGGDAETRPKSYAVNLYIKVDA